ncbi:U-box domain-containing protein [Musa troglodytarum]|nr:U-box domain-containing protein [Musa troglodytarum]
MCAPSILDTLIVALCFLSPIAAQHATATLYNLLSVEVYHFIIGSKKPLIVALSAPTRFIKDMLKALFDLALYPLNCIALVELNVVSSLFMLVKKDGRRGLVEDAMMVIAQVARYDENMEAFWRVNSVSI